MIPVSSRGKETRISFPFKGGWYSFLPQQIVRLEADSNYTYIFTTEHRPILMAKVLAEYVTLLEPFGFIRTHRSHLVNQLHIQSVSTSGQIVMKDTSCAEISRRKKKEVYSRLNLSPIAA